MWVMRNPEGGTPKSTVASRYLDQRRTDNKKTARELIPDFISDYYQRNIKRVTTARQILHMDCRSATRTHKINFLANRKGYDTFETTVTKLSARRIYI